MRRALLALAASLALFAGAGGAFGSGADHQLRDLSAAERTSVLDVTLIGEKWSAVAVVPASAAGGLLPLPASLHARGRNDAR